MIILQANKNWTLFTGEFFFDISLQVDEQDRIALWMEERSSKCIKMWWRKGRPTSEEINKSATFLFPLAQDGHFESLLPSRWDAPVFVIFVRRKSLQQWAGNEKSWADLDKLMQLWRWEFHQTGVVLPMRQISKRSQRPPVWWVHVADEDWKSYLVGKTPVWLGPDALGEAKSLGTGRADQPRILRPLLVGMLVAAFSHCQPRSLFLEQGRNHYFGLDKHSLDLTMSVITPVLWSKRTKLLTEARTRSNKSCCSGDFVIAIWVRASTTKRAGHHSDWKKWSAWASEAGTSLPFCASILLGLWQCCLTVKRQPSTMTIKIPSKPINLDIRRWSLLWTNGINLYIKSIGRIPFIKGKPFWGHRWLLWPNPKLNNPSQQCLGWNTGTLADFK